MQDYGVLTALIYDAALDPSLWPRALEGVSDALHGGATALLYQNQIVRSSGTGVTVRLDPSALRQYYDYADNNPLMRRNNIEWLRTISYLPITTDRQVLPKDEFVRTAYYNEFCVPNRMHSALMMSIAVADDRVATMNVMRPPGDPDFDAGDVAAGRRLQSHLARSFALTLRLAEGAKTREALDDVLQRSPHAMFLIDADGMVISHNRAADALFSRGAGLRLEERQLRAAVPAVSGRLAATIAAAVDIADPERHGGTVSIPRRGGGAPFSVLVTPVGQRMASAFAAGPAALVCVSDPGASIAPPAQLLREMFDLTPAETRVAMELITGLGSRAIAEKLGSSHNTVRVHLQRILDKTSTNRQADLVRVLLRTADLYPG